MNADVHEREQILEKEPLLNRVNAGNRSALQRYQDLFVGSTSFGDLLAYEFVTMFVAPMPGALGLFLRQVFFPLAFQRVGKGSAFGRNITLRSPGRISIGERVVVDNDCMLDAKDSGEEGISIGDDVLIARETTLIGKGAPIEIGAKSSIGAKCWLTSTTGLHIGTSVLIAGQTSIGGGRYRTDDLSKPIKEQELYSHGPIVIEDDVWIGSAAVIQDGVTIGRGSVIGSGAVVREDIPPYTVAVPHHRLVMLPRDRG